jgi:Cu/Ag efflux protein CusF
MKCKSALLLFALVLAACGGGNTVNNSSIRKTPSASPASASPTPVPTTATPKDGDYEATGVVTKVNLEQGSVEMDHEEIIGVMPAMRMEFYVTDKKKLEGLKVGDKVYFVLRYKDHTEKVVDIKKIQ